MDAITFLQDWFSSQCDGDWEHTRGISLGTLDNPGWWIKIELAGTHLEGQAFEPVKVERSSSNWVVAEVKDSVFEAYGGACNLSELLLLFQTWATSPR